LQVGQGKRKELQGEMTSEGWKGNQLIERLEKRDIPRHLICKKFYQEADPADAIPDLQVTQHHITSHQTRSPGGGQEQEQEQEQAWESEQESRRTGEQENGRTLDRIHRSGEDLEKAREERGGIRRKARQRPPTFFFPQEGKEGKSFQGKAAREAA
jgi:hypothetical protein